MKTLRIRLSAFALAAEIDAGAWHVLDADIELVLEGSVDTLWSRLIGRAESMTARIQPGAQRVYARVDAKRRLVSIHAFRGELRM
jgi:hypothetical protein